MAVMSGDVVAELERVLPSGRVVRDADVLASYSHDEAEWAPYGRPAAVVRPRDTAEVPEVVARCAEHWASRSSRAARAPACPAAPTRSTAAWSSRFEAMNAILEIDPDERLAVVQPGVVNDDLRARVRRARPLVPAGPGERAVVDHRRQRRHQRRRPVLREVRRHPRLRARHGGGRRPRRASYGSAAVPRRASPGTTWRA